MLRQRFMRVDPARLLVTLLGIEGALVLLFLLFCGGSDWPPLFRRWFNIDAENTVAAWFSSVQLMAVAMLCWVNGHTSEGAEGAVWRVGAAVFTFFSVDEAVSFHENTLFLLAALGFEVEMFWQRVSWIILYAVLGASLVTYHWRGVWALLQDKRRRGWLVGGTLTWLGGGMLVEGIGHGLGLIPYRGELGSLVQVVCEEGLEMVGVSLLLCGVLSRVQGLEVQIAE